MSVSTRRHRTGLGLALGVAVVACVVAAAPPDARAAEEHTWHSLTTGNGHGFQVFDESTHRITTFLEHPYRYVSARPGAPSPAESQGDGVERRNLTYDIYFGVKGAGGAAWLTDDTGSDPPEYVDQSNIIRVPATVSGTKAESYYFAPFGLERNVMVGLLHAPGATDGYALFNAHLGVGRPNPDSVGESMRAAVSVPKAIIETGPGGGAMIYVPIGAIDHADCAGVFDKGKSGLDLADKSDCAGDDLAAGFQKKLGVDGWTGFVVAFVDDAAGADDAAVAIDAWIGGRAPDKILTDARAEFEAWRKPPPPGTALCTVDEQKLWRQSEAVLRMGQVREANTTTRMNHGMLLASLPVGQWHMGWVRDASYAVVALARMGHHAEAKMALDFFLNAFANNPSGFAGGKYQDRVKNVPYRISVARYYGSGEEEADWNADGPNVETDGWGLVLWAARQYVEASGDLAWLDAPTFDGSSWDALVSGVAAPIEANLEASGIMAADSSIWEVHDAKKRHYAYTTLAAARGLCDMAGIAKKAGRAGDVTKYQALAKKVRDGFFASYVDAKGALGGSVEGMVTGKHVDCAVAEAFTWNILPDWKGATATATLDQFAELEVASGGYKRNDDGLSTYDDNEWVFADLRIAGALRRGGRAAEADALIAKVVSKAAANFYLVPELYDDTSGASATGDYTGAVPMVGYGGGAYAITMLDRSGLIEPNDCGDGNGATLPVVTCGDGGADGGDAGAGDGGMDGGDADDGAVGDVEDGGEAPSSSGCACALGPHRRLSPWGLGLLAFAPALLFARRRTRSKKPARSIR